MLCMMYVCEANRNKCYNMSYIPVLINNFATCKVSKFIKIN